MHPKRLRHVLRPSAISKSVSTTFFFLIISATCQPSWARSQKLSVRFDATSEASTLRHPDIEPSSTGYSWDYVPRFGVNIVYEAADWASLGIGPEVSFPRSYLQRNVSHQMLVGNLYATYMGILVPLTATLNFAHGVDWKIGVKLGAGPSFERWQTTAFRNPRGGRLPLVETSEWYPGFFGRLGISAEGRPTTWATISLGPYAGLTNRLNLSLGLAAQIGFL